MFYRNGKILTRGPVYYYNINPKYWMLYHGSERIDRDARNVTFLLLFQNEIETFRAFNWIFIVPTFFYWLQFNRLVLICSQTLCVLWGKKKVSLYFSEIPHYLWFIFSTFFCFARCTIFLQSSLFLSAIQKKIKSNQDFCLYSQNAKLKADEKKIQ